MEPQTDQKPPLIVESDDFLARLAEEVKRSDRYEHPFTVLVLRHPVRSGRWAANWFESVASGLIRGCDIVSVFEAEHIVAVLLPETGISGGSALLERLRTANAEADREWDCRLLAGC